MVDPDRDVTPKAEGLSRRSFLKTLTAGAAVGTAFPAMAIADQPPTMLHVQDEGFWARYRDQFPLRSTRYFLNTAGLGPSPDPVIDVLVEGVRENEYTGENGHPKPSEHAASLFGCDLDELGYTHNTTHGMSVIAAGLPLSAGDEVVITSHEHVGGLICWLNRRDNDGIVVKTFEPSLDPDETMQRLNDVLTPRTKVVSVSQVTCSNGLVLPVKQISQLCRDRGIFSVLDGAQAAGHSDFSLHDIGCDFWTTSGHKWLLGTKGTGYLYIKRERLDDLKLSLAGAYSTEAHLEQPMDLDPSARRHFVGTQNWALFNALDVAVRLVGEVGLANVQQRCQALATQLKNGLSKIGGVEILSPLTPANSVGITTFKLAGKEYGHVQGRMSNEFRLRTRGVYEGGLDANRVSTHVFNQPDEVERVIEAVRVIAAS